MTFKIATWNVNSLRVRLPHLMSWQEGLHLDVIALQETKIVDADFPLELLQTTDYAALFSGQKAYNGVAMLSRKKMSDMITDIPGFNDIQRRVLGMTVGDVRILNLYVPNGQSVTSEKYQYKLNWLENLKNFLQEELKKYPKIIILGDFNIAPDDLDVHDPLAWEGQVLCSVPEREAFRHILKLGFHDCFRMRTPTEQVFTWWDYRMNALKRNRGLRIDHILASDAIASACTNCFVDKTPRLWERPSDHAPVIAEFNF